jgi:hypothetical protein
MDIMLCEVINACDFSTPEFEVIWGHIEIPCHTPKILISTGK